MARTNRYEKTDSSNESKKFKKTFKQTRKQVKSMLKCTGDIVCESETYFEQFKY